MEPLRDPEEAETKYLYDVVNLVGARVLEIGCGDGRMTRRYASVPEFVIGIDPDIDRLAEAVDTLPTNLRSKVNFTQTQAESLPFLEEVFDVIILAWSL